MPKLKPYFHYTDATGYEAIIENEIGKDGRVFAIRNLSKRSLAGDAHYGEGWYITDIPPVGPPFSGDRRKIARALWDGSYEQNFAKTEYFLTLLVHGNTTRIECRRHVYLIPIDSKSRPTLGKYHRTDNAHLIGPLDEPPRAPTPLDEPPRAPTPQPDKIPRVRPSIPRQKSEPGLLSQLLEWLGF